MQPCSVTTLWLKQPIILVCMSSLNLVTKYWIKTFFLLIDDTISLQLLASPLLAINHCSQIFPFLSNIFPLNSNLLLSYLFSLACGWRLYTLCILLYINLRQLFYHQLVSLPIILVGKSLLEQLQLWKLLLAFSPYSFSSESAQD